MKQFRCASCGTVATNGTRVSVGESEGVPAVEIVTRCNTNESVRRVLTLDELAEKCKPEIPKAIKPGKPRGG